MCLSHIDLYTLGSFIAAASIQQPNSTVVGSTVKTELPLKHAVKLVDVDQRRLLPQDASHCIA